MTFSGRDKEFRDRSEEFIAYARRGRVVGGMRLVRCPWRVVAWRSGVASWSEHTDIGGRGALDEDLVARLTLVGADRGALDEQVVTVGYDELFGR